MTDHELIQQALEALQAYGAHTPNCDHLMLLTSMPPQRKPCSCGLVAAIIALRERLAQPEHDWEAAYTKQVELHNQTLDELRDALAQPVQEPVQEKNV